MNKINIKQKLELFSEYWSPKKIGELNDCNVMLVKCKGELPWHHHEEEDEMFIVVKGEFIVRFRDGEQVLKEGECAFVPRMVEHQTAAIEEAQIIYIAKKDTINTGNVKTESTVDTKNIDTI